MLVPNFLFDIILFGALLVAAAVDQSFPQFAGALSVIAVGAATYVAAQDWSDALHRRRAWSQEALSTAVALSTLGFIYFWWRNQSDLVLLVLSIGLMMASLMVAIATIAAFGSAIKEMRVAPVGGWLLTIAGACSLGVMAGVLALFLGGASTLFAKVLTLGVALFVWKAREAISPPAPNVLQDPASLGEMTKAAATKTAAVAATVAVHAAIGAAGRPIVKRIEDGAGDGRWFLLPQRGTLLDRFVPVLVLGALLFIAAQQVKSFDLWTPTPPAVAANGNHGTP
jgi:hypothetical protein